VLEDSGDRECAVAALTAMADDAPVAHDSLVSVPVRTRRGVIAEAVGLLSARGIGVDDINLRRPTLDDVFLSLTGHAAAQPGETTGEEEGPA
jgi:ABC-2 type transport system ATP-binding protein